MNRLPPDILLLFVVYIHYMVWPGGILTQHRPEIERVTGADMRLNPATSNAAKKRKAKQFETTVRLEIKQTKQQNTQTQTQ